MHDSNFYKFRAPSRTLAQLEMLGVILRAALGSISYEIQEGRAWKEIGRLGMDTATGRIIVQPYIGLTDRELNLLLGFAEDAFRNPPSEATGWIRSAQSPHRWECSALITTDLDEAAAAFVSAAETFVAATDTLIVSVDAEPAQEV